MYISCIYNPKKKFEGIIEKVGICPNYPDFLTIEIWKPPK